MAINGREKKEAGRAADNLTKALDALNADKVKEARIHLANARADMLRLAGH